jgi:hypothetical protein
MLLGHPWMEEEEEVTTKESDSLGEENDERSNAIPSQLISAVVDLSASIMNSTNTEMEIEVLDTETLAPIADETCAKCPYTHHGHIQMTRMMEVELPNGWIVVRQQEYKKLLEIKEI